MRLGLFVVMAGRNTTGPDAYERNLIRELAAGTHDELHVFCLNRQATATFSENRLQCHVLKPAMRWISIPVSLPLALRRAGIELMHATFVPPPFSPVNFVFTHHCFSTFVHPEFYRPATLYRLNKLITAGLRKARQVICVSENVRDLTREKFGVEDERLCVVYNGVSERFRPLPADQVKRALRQDFHIDRSYFLYAGNLQQRKNVGRLIRAYAEFVHITDNDTLLVLAGSKDQVAEDYDALILTLGLEERVMRLGHVPHEDLPVLYCGALAFAFPSLWEGFGMPVIEAMACGTPVLTSRLSSLPEVAGGAARLVDPYSVEDIASGLDTLYRDEALRTRMAAQGLARAREFSWKKTARETHAAYRRALL